MHCEPPHGHWDGGFCCGGETEAIFVEAELATLAVAGARPADLRPPKDTEELAGCVFRGPRGCSLAAEHRPSICLAHLCGDVGRELAGLVGGTCWAPSPSVWRPPSEPSHLR